MKIMMTEDDQEREIAEAAARVLHDSFIEAAQTGPVFYVENDVLMSKSPKTRCWKTSAWFAR